MKKSFYLSASAFTVATVILLAVNARAQGGYDMSHRGGRGLEYAPRGDWVYCPYCGRNFHAPPPMAWDPG